MLKVIIADDEPVIRNGIAKVIPWEKYGCEVAGIARNGEEALRYVEESEARIVISDIKMPKMNGLELLAEVRKREPEVFFLIVSGYDEFQYVQKALNHGAFGYLLKPIIPEELEEMLHRAVEKINGGKEAEINPETEREKAVLEKASLHWIPAYLDGRTEQEMTMPVKERKYCMFLIHQTRQEAAKKTVVPEQMIQMAETILVTHFSDTEHVIFTRKNCLIYIVLSDTKREGLEKQKERFLAQWEAKCADTGYAIAVSDRADEQKELRSLAGQLQRIARCQLYKDNQRMTDYEFELLWNEWKRRFEISYQEIKDLILAGEKESLLKIIERLIKRKTEEDKRDMAGDILFLCCEASVLYGQEVSDYRPDWLGFVKERLSSIKKPAELLEMVTEAVEHIFARLDAACSKNVQIMVERAKAIVRLDYGDSSLSLTSVAGRLGFNAAYFSRVFSLEAQQGFAEFLTDIRIKKSKELLLTDMKIQNIAERVGYNNQPYFSTRFRAETGLTPSQYREKYYDCLEETEKR